HVPRVSERGRRAQDGEGGRKEEEDVRRLRRPRGGRRRRRRAERGGRPEHDGLQGQTLTRAAREKFASDSAPSRGTSAAKRRRGLGRSPNETRQPNHFAQLGNCAAPDESPAGANCTPVSSSTWPFTSVTRKV